MSFLFLCKIYTNENHSSQVVLSAISFTAHFKPVEQNEGSHLLVTELKYLNFKHLND